jgi:hypothetical protein
VSGRPLSATSRRTAGRRTGTSLDGPRLQLGVVAQGPVAQLLHRRPLGHRPHGRQRQPPEERLGGRDDHVVAEVGAPEGERQEGIDVAVGRRAGEHDPHASNIAGHDPACDGCGQTWAVPGRKLGSASIGGIYGADRFPPEFTGHVSGRSTHVRERSA